MLTWIVVICAYVALVVIVLAMSRKRADTESLRALMSKVLLVHAILAGIGLEIVLLVTCPIAGWLVAGIGGYAWLQTHKHRRQLRALKWFQGRLVKLG